MYSFNAGNSDVSPNRISFDRRPVARAHQPVPPRSDLEISAEAAVVPRLRREGEIEIRDRTSCRGQAGDSAAPGGNRSQRRSDCERPVGTTPSSDTVSAGQ